jgi:hypothetical protein
MTNVNLCKDIPTIVVNSSGKFATNVNKYRGQLAAGVDDIGGAL